MTKAQAIEILSRLQLLRCYNQDRVGILRPRHFQTTLLEIVPAPSHKADVQQFVYAIETLIDRADADNRRRQERNLRRRLAKRQRGRN